MRCAGYLKRTRRPYACAGNERGRTVRWDAINGHNKRRKVFMPVKGFRNRRDRSFRREISYRCLPDCLTGGWGKGLILRDLNKIRGLLRTFTICPEGLFRWGFFGFRVWRPTGIAVVLFVRAGRGSPQFPITALARSSILLTYTMPMPPGGLGRFLRR